MSSQSISETPLQFLGINSNSVKSIRPHSRRSGHRAAIHWLTQYNPPKESSKLNLVQGYLNAFHHYCEIEEWEIAAKLLAYPLTSEPGYELLTALFKWGYYNQMKSLCELLIRRVNPAIDIMCYRGIGQAYHFSSDYQSAISNYSNCLRIARKIDDRYQEGSALGNLGLALSAIGQYQTALEMQEKALEIMVAFEDKKGEGNALGCIGLIHESLGQHTVAIEYYQKQLNLSRSITDQWEEGNPLGEIGKSLHSLGRYREAIRYHQQRLDIANKIDDRLGKSHALRNLGRAYSKIGKYQAAISYCHESQEVSQAIGDRRGEGIAIQYMGEIYLSLGRKEEATVCLETALTIFQNINWIKNQREVENLLEGGWFNFGQF